MRTFKNKILFKLVRLPLPWMIRKLINDFLMLMSFRKLKATFDIEILKRNGFEVIKVEDIGINRESLEVLIDELNTCKVQDQWRGIPGEYNLGEIPESMNVGEVVLNEYLQNKIHSIGERLSNNERVVGYFGGKPILVDSSVWWSFGGRTEREAQLWHRDIDNIYFLKVFIYLTDVTTNDGPHFYIPKSHRYIHNLTFERYSDDQISNIRGLSKPVAITGGRGSVIIEDTFGFHKGSAPIKGHSRLLLQYQFASFRNP